jgi:hypothetical protein
MLSAKLGPFRKLVLTARRVELFSKLQELGLECALLCCCFRGWSRETIVDIPELFCISGWKLLSGRGGRKAHQGIDGSSTNGVH